MRSLTCKRCGSVNSDCDLNCTACGLALSSEGTGAHTGLGTEVTVTLPTVCAPLPGAENGETDPSLESTMFLPTDTDRADTIQPGQILDHFKVIEKLGHGGMGTVYKARDLKLDRFVALKVIRMVRMGSAHAARQLLKEAKTASALNHPNIVTIYDIIRDKDLDFIAMEWVDGRTLKELIPKGGLAIDDCLKYALRIADGLARAHREGIIHRDIKPSNIMVTRDSKVKILDFGVAKFLESEEWEKAVSPSWDRADQSILKGTLPYMSPEQVRGQATDARSDIFSFGILLYRMLTGKRPFPGRDIGSLLTQITATEPKPMDQFRADLLPGFHALVGRCLQKDPKHRFQDMDEVVVALETFPRGRRREDRQTAHKS